MSWTGFLPGTKAGPRGMSELRSQAKACQLNDGQLTVFLGGHCHPLTSSTVNINITDSALRTLGDKCFSVLSFLFNFFKHIFQKCC